MSKAPYSILINEIGENDINLLNLLFSRMNANVTVQRKAFINYAETVKIDHRKKYKIQVEIKGYKRYQGQSEKGPSPIWKITSISNML